MKKLIMASITAVVVIVVLAGTLIPILDDATATSDTFTNEGYYRMSNTEEETVITWTPSVDPLTITVNGADVSLNTLSQYGYSSYSLAFSDDFIVRYYYESASAQSIQIWTDSFKTGIGSSSAYTATITINDSGVSFVTSQEGATTTNITHTGDYFVINNTGNYIMKNRNIPAYVLEDSSIIYAGGISLIVGSSYTSIYIEGTVTDYDVTVLNANTSVSNKQSVYTEDDNYIGLVKLDKLTFTTTHTAQDNTTTDKNQTYSYFLVPYEVTAERSVHFTDGENAIFNAIPVIVIVALLLAIVAMVIRSRMD